MKTIICSFTQLVRFCFYCNCGLSPHLVQRCTDPINVLHLHVWETSAVLSVHHILSQREIF